MRVEWLELPYTNSLKLRHPILKSVSFFLQSHGDAFMLGKNTGTSSNLKKEPL